MEYNGAGRVVGRATHTGGQERLAIGGELVRDLKSHSGEEHCRQREFQGLLISPIWVTTDENLIE